MKLLVLLACVAFAAAERKRYDGYQVLELTVEDQSQKSALDQLRYDEELDFWTDTALYGRPIHVMVPPHRLLDVEMLLKNAGITHSVLHHNVQDQIDTEHQRVPPETRDFDLNDFNTYADIVTQLGVWQAACPSAFTCSVYSIGTSGEGRDLWVFSITGSGAGRGGHFIDSAIHAREWLAPATVLYVIDHMINGYGSDSEVTGLLDADDFYFLPVVNPDGYEFTFSDDRLWRKNRAPNDGSACIGTDLNRNFAHMWDNGGSSNNPCSDTYHGSGPGSELETTAVQNEAVRLSSSLTSWTSIHTYGYMWMHSWGWAENPNTIQEQCVRTDDHADQYQVVEAIAIAVQNTHGPPPTWAYGTICEVIYTASGGTVDYTYGTAGIKYSYTPELRGDGFVVPPSEIVPSFQEVWNGILAMVAEIAVIEG